MDGSWMGHTTSPNDGRLLLSIIPQIQLGYCTRRGTTRLGPLMRYLTTLKAHSENGAWAPSQIPRTHHSW